MCHLHILCTAATRQFDLTCWRSWVALPTDVVARYSGRSDEQHDDPNNHSNVPQANVAVPVEGQILVQPVPINHELGDEDPGVEQRQAGAKPDPERELIERNTLHGGPLGMAVLVKVEAVTRHYASESLVAQSASRSDGCSAHTR